MKEMSDSIAPNPLRGAFVPLRRCQRATLNTHNNTTVIDMNRANTFLVIEKSSGRYTFP